MHICYLKPEFILVNCLFACLRRFFGDLSYFLYTKRCNCVRYAGKALQFELSAIDEEINVLHRISEQCHQNIRLNYALISSDWILFRDYINLAQFPHKKSSAYENI